MEIDGRVSRYYDNAVLYCRLRMILLLIHYLLVWARRMGESTMHNADNDSSILGKLLLYVYLCQPIMRHEPGIIEKGKYIYSSINPKNVKLLISHPKFLLQRHFLILTVPPRIPQACHSYPSSLSHILSPPRLCPCCLYHPFSLPSSHRTPLSL